MATIKCYRLGNELVVTDYREEVLGYVSLSHSALVFIACDGYGEHVGEFPTESAAVVALQLLAGTSAGH
jgi:hypothetical protein